jgi:hypothetical protein
MTPLKWDAKAWKAYREISGKLGPLKRELLEQRIDALRTWPPEKWFDLRDKEGVIRFQTDPEQFLGLNGIYDKGTVYITYFGIRTRGRD